MVSQRSHHRESRTTSSSRCHNVEFGVGPFHQLWLHGRALSQADERLPVTLSRQPRRSFVAPNVTGRAVSGFPETAGRSLSARAFRIVGRLRTGGGKVGPYI